MTLVDTQEPKRYPWVGEAMIEGRRFVVEFTNKNTGILIEDVYDRTGNKEFAKGLISDRWSEASYVPLQPKHPISTFKYPKPQVLVKGLV